MSSMKSQLSCPTRPAWFEVDLARLSSNFRLIRKDASNDLIIGSVVKDNGYGHGCVEVANVALANGAQLLLVSNLDEAFAAAVDAAARRYAPACRALVPGRS